MGEKKEKRIFSIRRKSFAAKHWLGWVMSVASLVLGLIVSKVYMVFRAPFEATVAVNQVNDSIADFVVHQQMTYNNLVGNVIFGVTAVLVVLFLVPTIRGLIREARGN